MLSRSAVSLAVFLTVLLLAVPVAGHGALPAADYSVSQPTSPAATPGAATATEEAPREPDRLNTTFRAVVQSDGDARWYVEARFNRTDAFETFAERFEDGETTDLGLDAFEAAVDEARAASGREMELRSTQRYSEVDNGTGTLVLSFTWTNFARTEGERLYIEDAFTATTPSGTWLPDLQEDQALVIVPPSGYGVHSTPIGVSDGVARWEGPYTFSDREPWIVYERGVVDPVTPTTPTPSPTPRTTTPPPTTTTTVNTTTAPPTTAGPSSDGLSAAWPFLLVAVLAVAAVAAYAFRDEPIGTSVAAESDGRDGGASAAEAVAGSPVGGASAADGGESGPTAGAGTSETAAGAIAGSGGAAAGASDEEIDEELLSDEERVERLLERNGGRMKQATIVKETGWSNAKVSQLLSSMAQEERIDKLRIGRENLISFPDEDVTDVDSG